MNYNSVYLIEEIDKSRNILKTKDLSDMIHCCHVLESNAHSGYPSLLLSVWRIL